jgi:hypothetical protein
VFAIQDEEVIGAPDAQGPEARERNPVFQLQRMFAFLQESTLSYYDPTAFIATIK